MAITKIIADSITSGAIANTPAFFIKKSSTQALNDNATTLVTFTSEVFDTNNAFANSKFTVPSGQAGKYFFGVQPYIRDADEQLTRTAVTFQKNGSSNGFIETQFISKIINQNLGATTVLDLAVGDYINVGVFGDTADSGTFNVYGETDFYSYFYGFKILT
jgi:hypothetical protein|tara:strand:- start:25 stop:507 length:483 start_codon:yes stop_codon:yes gene_type:complete